MTLKNVLLINAVSSGVTGILLALTPGFFATLFNVNTTFPFTAVGIFLIIFSLFVLTNAFRDPIQKSWTKVIIGLDISWVLGSVIAVAILFSSISLLGSIIIIAVAGWVGLMAYLQNKGLTNI